MVRRKSRLMATKGWKHRGLGEAGMMRPKSKPRGSKAGGMASYDSKRSLGWTKVTLLLLPLGFLFVKVTPSLTDLPFFQLKKIQVRGNYLLTEKEIISLSGIQIGLNLFKIDLKEAAGGILEEPTVREVTLSRKPPHEVEISVVERKPVALVNLDRLYGVDREGVLLRPFAPQLLPDLPVFTRVKADSYQVGQVLPILSEGIALLEEIRRLDPLLVDEISEVRLNGSEGVTLYLAESGLKVRMVRDKLTERIAVLHVLLRRPEVMSGRPRYLDLRFEDQAIVGWGG